MVQPKRKKSANKSKSGITPPQGAFAGVFVSTPPNLQQEDFKSVEHIFNEVEDYAIIMMDVKGNITSWNRGAEKIKGYKREEIVGKNYRIFYTSEDKENNLSEKLLNEAAKNGRTSYEGWRVRKDGTRFWGSVALTALHDKTGNIRGYLKVTRDLTKKKWQRITTAISWKSLS